MLSITARHCGSVDKTDRWQITEPLQYWFKVSIGLKLCSRKGSMNKQNLHSNNLLTAINKAFEQRHILKIFAALGDAL